MPNQGTIHYFLRKGKTSIEKSYSFEYVAVQKLPDGKNIEVVFRQAIRFAKDSTVKAVLIDLYRFLVFSNFARFNGYQELRPESLQDLDREYPFANAIIEGKTFTQSKHLSARTNTIGATLYLLMQSKNSPEVNLILGGILMDMNSYDVFSQPVRIHLAV